MVTPRQQHTGATPADDRATILRRVATAARKRERAEADELDALRLASAAGISLRDIAAAADRSHATVDRMLKRDVTENPDPEGHDGWAIKRPQDPQHWQGEDRGWGDSAAFQRVYRTKAEALAEAVRLGTGATVATALMPAPRPA